MMQNAEATEDYCKVAKDLLNAKACDYFTEYVISFCERAFDHMTRLAAPVSTCNNNYLCVLFSLNNTNRYLRPSRQDLTY
jgi:hypothetical protein